MPYCTGQKLKLFAQLSVKKAELIEGVVYIPAVAGWNQHAAPRADLIGWLGFYRASHPTSRWELTVPCGWTGTTNRSRTPP